MTPPTPDEPTSFPVGSYQSFEHLEEGRRTAMLCEGNVETREAVRGVLRGMDYWVIAVESVRDALEAMRFHAFDAIVLDERFDTEDPDRQELLLYLENLPMTLRRWIFVVLLSDRYRTLDSLTAFQRSVHCIINTQNMKDFETIFRHALSDHEAFTRIFQETLKNLGRL